MRRSMQYVKGPLVDLDGAVMQGVQLIEVYAARGPTSMSSKTLPGEVIIYEATTEKHGVFFSPGFSPP